MLKFKDFKFYNICLTCAGKMAPIVLLAVGVLSMLSMVQGNNGGWIDAHATFYGGGDASGTMGKKLKTKTRLYIFYNH